MSKSKRLLLSLVLRMASGSYWLSASKMSPQLGRLRLNGQDVMTKHKNGEDRNTHAKPNSSHDSDKPEETANDTSDDGS